MYGTQADPMIRMMVRRRHIANRLARHGLADDAHHRLAEPAIRAILRRFDDEHVVVERDEQHVLIDAVDVIDQIDILRERLHGIARLRRFRRQGRVSGRQHESRFQPRGIDLERDVVDARRHLTRSPHQTSSRQFVRAARGVSREQRVERRVAEQRIRVEGGDARQEVGRAIERERAQIRVGAAAEDAADHAMRPAVDRLFAGIAERVDAIQRRQQHELRHVQQAIVEHLMLARGHQPHGLAGMIQAIALHAVDHPELLVTARTNIRPSCPRPCGRGGDRSAMDSS